MIVEKDPYRGCSYFGINKIDQDSKSSFPAVLF